MGFRRPSTYINFEIITIGLISEEGLRGVTRLVVLLLGAGEQAVRLVVLALVVATVEHGVSRARVEVVVAPYRLVSWRGTLV